MKFKDVGEIVKCLQNCKIFGKIGKYIAPVSGISFLIVSKISPIDSSKYTDYF